MYPRRLTLACAFLLTLAGVPACSSPPDAQTRSAATLPAAVVENKYTRATEAVRDLFKQAPPPDNPSTLYPTPAVMADFQKSTYLRDQVVRLTLSLSAQDSKSTVLWAQTLPEDICDVTRHTIQQTAMTAWAEKDPVSATAALQKTRDAYQALDDAVRQTMKKDPAIDALIQKYPYLLYGRRDLGFEVAAIYFTT
jgi:hypothetical protein